MFITSESSIQVPMPVVVRVSEIDPAESSVAVGVYVALRAVALGLKVPFPPVQIPPVALSTDPFKVICALLLQTVWLFPALATGAGEIDMVTSSLTGVQFPFPTEVSVSVTLPLAISVAEGV